MDGERIWRYRGIILKDHGFAAQNCDFTFLNGGLCAKNDDFCINFVKVDALKNCTIHMGGRLLCTGGAFLHSKQ